MENRGLSNTSGGIGNATTNKFTKYEGNRTDVTSAVDFAYKTIDQLAQYARHKTDSWLNALGMMPIDEFCTFSGRNYVFRKRLMDLNDKEIGITLANIGIDASHNGDSSIVTSSAPSPSYASKRNYLDKFQRQIGTAESKGEYSTRVTDRSEGWESGNYTGINQLYGNTRELYPDDNDTGVFTNKWRLDGNNDSILSKTKALFRSKKINTLISRFYNDGQLSQGNGEVGTVKFRESHGRNLLTKDAEDSGAAYNINGYNNPYCRVWTHHHQYDRYWKTIRHFYEGEDGGKADHVDFHDWSDFKLNDDEKQFYKGFGWKDSSNSGWEHSVLNREVDMPNITPSYNNGEHIHTKDCMFSIENLAWKGYDPYSFEQALSWEQRGPNGGRIMWFPPYGIQFNETTSASWNEHNFIGRGEPVYTYVNTARRGTLNFMLVVDHPSIVDYVSWNEANENSVKDTDLLRFFAGCDVNTLKKAAKPTPLTDEYFKLTVPEGVKPEPWKPTPVKEPEPPMEPNPGDDNPVTVTFYVFYPNNYSGHYDVESGSVVEPMAYLLGGIGAQKNNGDSKSDHPISFKNLSEDTSTDSLGYEMGDKPVSPTDPNQKNFIVGTTVEANKWYYRIDGKYEKNTTNDTYWNCYNQKLRNNINYSDNKSYRANSDVEVPMEWFEEQLTDNEEIAKASSIFCSFAEFAGLLTTDTKIRECVFRLGDISAVYTNPDSDTEDGKWVQHFDDGRIDKIYQLLHDETYKIESYSVKGYSNIHGNNPNNATNAKRNENLAIGRAKSVLEWLKKYNDKFNNKSGETGTIKYDSSVAVAAKDQADVSGETAKKYRSAKVEIKFTKTKTKVEAAGNTIEDSIADVDIDTGMYKDFVFVKETVEDGMLYYNSNDKGEDQGRLWYHDDSDGLMKLLKYKGYNSGITPRRDQISDMPKDNKLRYDQEYHFFRALKRTDPVIFDRLMKKLQYFDPAFHSMTPEGFNGRLTFLQQCLRQGNTVGAVDSNRKSANNLAFGRQPYCVLRLGDFLNQMIVIRDISFNYDPLVWDTNTEGIGVQPLLCQVSMSFEFIGGADIAGCVRRLQNAMSFNYYANASLYDNRADRVNPKWDDKTNGALTQGELEPDGNWFYETDMIKPGT